VDVNEFNKSECTVRLGENSARILGDKYLGTSTENKSPTNCTKKNIGKIGKDPSP
jgi:hypothetical protein